MNRREGLTLGGVLFPEAVVGELVEEAVEEGGRSLLVHSVLACLGEVVGLLDVLALLGAASDSHHPEELVHICVCVANAKQKETLVKIEASRRSRSHWQGGIQVWCQGQMKETMVVRGGRGRRAIRP